MPLNRLAEPAAPAPSSNGHGKPHMPPSIKFRTWDELLAIAANQQEDWYIEGWAEFGSLLLFTGLPFSGKSTIIAEIIAASALGRLWAGREVQRVPVILLDLENKERILVQRIQRALAGDEGIIRRLFYQVPLENMVRPLSVEWIDQAVKALKEELGNRAAKGVVVVDTMRSAFGKDEIDPVVMSNLLYALQAVAMQSGWLIFVLHHNAKYSNRYSGTTAIAAAADTLWNWTSDKKKHIATLDMETRADYQDPLEFKFDVATNRLLYVSSDDAADAKAHAAVVAKAAKENENAQTLFTVMKTSAAPGVEERAIGGGEGWLTVCFERVGKSPNFNVLSEAMQALVNLGFVLKREVSPGTKKYFVYRLSPQGVDIDSLN